MASNKPPAIRINGIRGPIPSGYILGRTSVGYGDVELLSMQKLQSAGLIPVTLPGPPTGPAGGDLGGTYPNPTVAKINTQTLPAPTSTAFTVLMYSGGALAWVNQHMNGGSTGMVATKNSNTDFDISWATPHYLTTGGTAGQVLSKINGTDYNAAWTDPHYVIAGGTAGQVLAKLSGTDYDVTWVDQTGGGSGGGAASIRDDGSNIYIAMSDTDGQLVLDAGGDPIFSLEVFPAASQPLGSDSAFGAFKVDNLSIAALLGVIGTKFLGFLYTKTTTTSVSDSVITKMVFDSVVVDTTGGAYNTATGKFTATKAGKYLCFAVGIGEVNTTMAQTAVWVARNGTIGSGGTVLAVAGMGQASFNTARSVSALVLGIADLNGTTDFIEMDVFVSGTGGGNKINNPGASFFGAIYVGV